MKFPQSSVTLYLLKIVSGHVSPSDVSSSQVTVGNAPLSASSVTTVGSVPSTSPIHSTFIGSGLVAVGAIGSVINIRCVTLIVFPQSSVTL